MWAFSKEMMFKLPRYTWDKDRELCKRCKHYREQQDASSYNGGGMVMRCAANPFKASKGIGSCIDNRTRGPCGKEGKLFEAGEEQFPLGSPALHQARKHSSTALRPVHESIG